MQLKDDRQTFLLLQRASYFFLFLLFGSSVNASIGQIKLSLYSTSARSYGEQNNTLNLMPSENLAVSYRRAMFGYTLEYQKFENEVQVGLTHISRHHQEVIGWLEFYWPDFEYLGFYSGLGGGASKDNLRTKFNDTTFSDNLPLKPLFALKLGSELRLKIGKTGSSLFLNGELQGIFSENLDPSPNLGTLVRTGILF